MKKVFLLVICLLILTGCSAEYNLSIDKDLKVKEEVDIYESDSYFDEFYLDTHSTIINRTLTIENEEGISNKQLLENNNYNYKFTANGINAIKTYNSIKDYINNTIFKNQPFKTIEYVENNGLITVTAKDFVEYDPECIGQYDVEFYKINLKSEYQIINSNANYVEENKGSCYWIIDSNREPFELSFTIDTNNTIKNNDDTLEALLYLIIILVLVVGYAIYSKKSVK